MIKNWCDHHRINYEDDQMCPECSKELTCLFLSAVHQMETKSISATSAMSPSQSTDSKTTMTTDPTADANKPQEAKKTNQDSVPTAEKSEHVTTAHHLIKRTLKNGVSWGILFRWKSLWVGGHYSYKEKRYCINLLPCVTIWFTKPGGAIPYIA